LEKSATVPAAAPAVTAAISTSATPPPIVISIGFKQLDIVLPVSHNSTFEIVIL
jgi:hypothetical protein